FLRERLAFRGGTALHKLYLKPQPRYSEDIDLVQIKPEPIKETLAQLQSRLAFLGPASVEQKRDNNTLKFRFESEIPPVQPLRLKVEINCREHFNVMGLQEFPFAMESDWFSGNADILTYAIEELLGTKLRALYQRRKGRDLYDLYKAYQNERPDTEKVVNIYREYVAFSVDHPPTRKQFLRNLETKMQDNEFLGDTQGLLRPTEKYNAQEAFNFMKDELLMKL
ncbi:MAG TPA: nucleotidyl transferase AbiEii/AbiGii toxin family protein, partial [Pyrinomonadaceae bacterium]|nr:nucleotidyl transferase AbiEii/AbiGii toxin family protein [Pyrinomonadaceae bacterium]